MDLRKFIVKSCHHTGHSNDFTVTVFGQICKYKNTLALKCLRVKTAAGAELQCIQGHYKPLTLSQS